MKASGKIEVFEKRDSNNSIVSGSNPLECSPRN
jgi:hypothetical protein